MSEPEEPDTALTIIASHAQARTSQQIAASIVEQQHYAIHASVRAIRVTPAAAMLYTRAQVPTVFSQVGLLLQTVVELGEQTPEGHLIEAVTLPWFEIVSALDRDPAVAFQISPRKWEEMVAGAYERAGFEEVTLTPRSGDGGRDVIAVKFGLGRVRIIDQVKAYKPGNLVTADDVRALMGVLHTDGAAKGFLTTTSDFAPKLSSDPLIAPLIPSRLDLVNGTTLFRRLRELARKA